MSRYRKVSTTPARDAMLAVTATAVGLCSSDDLINAAIDAMLASLAAGDPVLMLAIARAGGAAWDTLESSVMS